MTNATIIAKAGLYSLAGDIDDLYANLERLASNSDFYSSLSANGSRFYETELDSDKAVINITNTYLKTKNNAT